MIYQRTKAKSIVSSKDNIAELVNKTIDQMATVVGRTLGPGGNPVLIDRGELAPLITKDGVTVAKSLGVSDAAANIVIDSCKEICINTATEAGDGTTTAIVLGNAIVKYGQKFLQENPKYNPQKMINELKTAYEQVIVPFIKDISVETKTAEELLNVATVSANGDVELAESVVEAVYAAGENGTVLITEGQGRNTKVETVNGYVMTSGLKELGNIGPVFINEKANQHAKMDKGVIFLYDGTLNDLIIPSKIQDVITDQYGHADTGIIVMAHGFADSVLDAFAKATSGGNQVIPVKTVRSGLPNGASMFLEDMAAYCDTFVYHPGNIEELTREDLGFFDEAKITMYETVIKVNEPNVDAIETRVHELKAHLDQCFSEMDRTWLRAAIAKLTCGVATIVVGGSTDLEIREKKDRVEDAVEAVRSAESEGIITGGCTTHLMLCNALKADSGYKPSWQILTQALHEPFKLLLSNCGEDYGDIYPELEQELQAASKSRRLPKKAFNAKDHDFSDPKNKGLIEPAKVCRVSIGNALSVATLLTTLGGIVVVPRDAAIEAQIDATKAAFSTMMNAE